MTRSLVRLSAWVDPALREYARLEAKRAGLSFSTFIERAVQQAVAKASADRAIRDADIRDWNRAERAARRTSMTHYSHSDAAIEASSARARCAAIDESCRRSRTRLALVDVSYVAYVAAAAARSLFY